MINHRYRSDWQCAKPGSFKRRKLLENSCRNNFVLFCAQFLTRCWIMDAPSPQPRFFHTMPIIQNCVWPCFGTGHVYVYFTQLCWANRLVSNDLLAVHNTYILPLLPTVFAIWNRRNRPTGRRPSFWNRQTFLVCFAEEQLSTVVTRVLDVRILKTELRDLSRKHVGPSTTVLGHCSEPRLRRVTHTLLPIWWLIPHYPLSSLSDLKTNVSMFSKLS